MGHEYTSISAVVYTCPGSLLTETEADKRNSAAKPLHPLYTRGYGASLKTPKWMEFKAR